MTGSIKNTLTVVGTYPAPETFPGTTTFPGIMLVPEGTVGSRVDYEYDSLKTTYPTHPTKTLDDLRRKNWDERSAGNTGITDSSSTTDMSYSTVAGKGSIADKRMELLMQETGKTGSLADLRLEYWSKNA